MGQDLLGEAIYKKYIEPLKRPRTDAIGIEFELPIVNLSGGPVDFEAVHDLTGRFLAAFHFIHPKRDDNGHIYCAEDPATGDVLSYDCSYNTLEFSFGIERDLHVIYQRFLRYYRFIEKQLALSGHTLTGMGLNPARDVNLREPIANGRYRMLLHHLESYTRYGQVLPFHDKPYFGLFSCASQIHCDVDEDTVVEVLDTFNKLEPLKAILFANSPYGDMLESRDYFWNYSMHGVNPHNVGMWQGPVRSLEGIAQYIRSMSLYCMERDEKYINIPPMLLDNYFNADTVYGEYYDGNAYRPVEVVPKIEDLAYLRSFKLDDLTFRGTVEFRSVSEQPLREIMAPAAYTVGLLENLHALTELLGQDTVLYGGAVSPIRWRMLLSKREFPTDLNRKALSDLLISTVALAENGLKKHGRGEETFLQPLYARAENLTNPAKDYVASLAGGVPQRELVERYAEA